MPWRTQQVMDLRMEFVRKAMQAGVNFRALCRETGISPKTGYKWKRRFEAEGKSGLCDVSRRPHRSPAQAPEAVVCELVRLKQAHRTWGPRKIHDLYRRLHGAPPSVSTCKRILAKAGLVEPRRVRRQSETGHLRLGVVAQAPNDVWTVDFKGWWRTGDGERCEPLTVRDAHSRCVLCAQAMARNTAELVRLQFERLFQANGLPRVIRSDNGPPFAAPRALFGLSRLAAWWLALGIDLDRSRPGHPQDNGAHERMHRDLRAEVQAWKAGSVTEQQAALDLWRETFNRQRPHEALGMKTPAEVYVRSSRNYTGTPNVISYGPEHIVRRVNGRGFIQVHGQILFISECFCGWEVGLKPDGHDSLEVWFAQLQLGRIDLTTARFLPVPSHRQEPRSAAHLNSLLH